MKNFSLKLRLSIILLFLFAISSIIAISISMYQTKKTLVEVLDTQLYYFAKRVANSNINTLINSSNLNYELNNINEDIAEKYMSIEDDSLTYAIYSLDGKIIYKDFSEENNDNFVFNNNILNTNDGLLFEENKEFKKVYLLAYYKEYKDETEDTKILGFFSTAKKAREYLAEYKIKKNLKPRSRGYYVNKWYVDLYFQWEGGFITFEEYLESINQEK